VFVGAFGPVKAGLVASLNRPGGNVTGVTFIGASLGAKRLELARELAPNADLIALLTHPYSPDALEELRDLLDAAKAIGQQLFVLTASSERDFGAAFDAISQHRAGVLIIGADPFFFQSTDQLVTLMLRHRIPTVFTSSKAVVAGGLVSYSGNANAAIVAVLCRQLGGIPLAIELAASRIDVFGVAELAADLRNGLKLLQRGRRTAVPRHQTLRAALNWSFELLSHDEQTILARLSVFRSPFDMEAAVAVVADDKISRANVIDGIADLTAKSLVAANVSDPTTCFYLLETTRAYAAEKLLDPAPVAQRHAEHLAAFFERAEADLETRQCRYSSRRTAGALMTYGPHWIGLFPPKATGRSAWH
jgi:hypothetical protein